MLAKLVARQLRRRRRPVAALDPMNDPGWAAASDYLARDLPDLWFFLRTHKRIHAFIDESAISVRKFDDEANKLTTISGHLEHSVNFLCQSLTQLSPTLRGQTTITYLFPCTEESWDIVGRLHNCRQRMAALRPLAWDLQTFSEFFIIRADSTIRRYRLTYRTKAVIELSE